MKVFLKSAAFVAALLTTTLVSAQETKIRFFGQPEITSSQITETNMFKGVDAFGQYVTKDTTYSKSNFNTGNLVLFVTSQISERISVLSEVSFNNSGKEFSVEVQRLAFKYYVKDYFSIRAGKMFTPIGYWNNQFTLGLVLQPTIQRPLAIRPSGNGGGGVLQFRDTGIQFEGDNITNARFFYKVLLGNGVGYYGSNDKGDNHIATTVQLGAEPIEGLKIIGSGMFDRIESGKPNPNGSVSSLPDNGNLQLLVGSVAYMNPEKKAEFIFEYLAQKSNFDNIKDTKSHSYYGYAGYKVTDKITPYVLYNSTQAGESKTLEDQYFSPIPVKIELLTLGVRYKFNSSFVCKLEYEMNNEKYFYQDITMPDGAGGTIKLDDGFTNNNKTNSVRVQLAFVF
jgi:hypothetical protein